MSLTRLLAVLADLDPDEWDVAEALWLAGHLRTAEHTRDASVERSPPDDGPGRPSRTAAPDDGYPAYGEVAEPGGTQPGWEDEPGEVALYLPGKPGELAGGALPVRVPAAEALPAKLATVRALRPLKRRVADPHRLVLDEQLTADRIAEEGLWLPVLRPKPDRWLDLALVADAASSMVVWRSLVAELRSLLESLAAFRDIRTYSLGHDPDRGLCVYRGTYGDSVRVSPGELTDPTGRRLVLVVSDCVSTAWHSGAAGALLAAWGRTTSVAILQPLPERMWSRTGLRLVRGRLSADAAGVANSRLRFTPFHRRRQPPPGAVPIPILQLDPDWLAPWAGMVAKGSAGMDAVVTLAEERPPRPVVIRSAAERRSASELVNAFRASASPDAFQLATYMSVLPVSLQVMRLVQQTVLSGSRAAHLAEVLLGGLLIAAPNAADGGRYEFVNGVRDVLRPMLRRSDVRRMFRRLSLFLAGRMGIGLHEFVAAVGAPATVATEVVGGGPPLAHLPTTVLSRLGGRYRELVELLVQSGGTGEGGAYAPGAPRPSAEGSTDPHVLDWLVAPDDQPELVSSTDDLVLRRPLLDDAVHLCREAVRMTGGGAPVALAALTRALRARYEAGGGVPDLAEALSTVAQALESRAAQDRVLRAELLTEAAELRVLRYHEDGLTSDLSDAIGLFTAVLDLTAPDDTTARTLGLADALYRRFERLRAPADLDEAVGLYRRALATASTQVRVALAGLVRTLTARYWDTGDLADLDEAVAVLDALDPGGRSGQLEWERSEQLADLLRVHFGHTHASGDLDRAIALYREAAAGSAGLARAAVLRKLADALFAAFMVSGDDDNVDEAVRAAHAAVEATRVGDPEHSACLLTLVRLHLARADRHNTARPADVGGATGGDDIDAAVRACRRLLNAVPRYHPDRPETLHLLGAALQARYARWGDLGDLAEACSSYEQAAAEAAPDSAPQGWYLSSLAGALRIRAASTGSTGDLDQARRHLQAALSATPVDDPEYPERTLVLAEVLVDQARLEPARTAYRASIDGFARRYGAEDPRTLEARLGFGRALSTGGHPEEALVELSAVVRMLTHRYGADDVHTLAARHEEAVALGAAGQPDEARQRLDSVLSSRIDVLGPAHPHTAATRAAIHRLG